MPTVDFSALKPPGPPTTVVAAWEPAVSNGENSERGFGGRVYFYDQDLRPVKVKGTVVVYAFDEDGRDKWDSRPNEGYVFDSKTLNSREVYSKSRLGHSYNLWIPVDATSPDNPSRKISLIVRYIPEKGASLVSQQATALLPGRRAQDQFIAQVGASEWDGPAQEVVSHSMALHSTALHSTAMHSPPPRARLTEERIIESNTDRARTMQAETIR